MPSIMRTAEQADVILARGGSDGISHAYNSFIADACALTECEALVLLHDDVEIIDRNFRAKILAALRKADVGVVGVVGGLHLTSLAWWDARQLAGQVLESRGPIDFGHPWAEVHAVDGLLLVISPRAFRDTMFDEESFPRFHGYDVDYCLAVRRSGLRVMVAPIELVHRTVGGYGATAAYKAADQALRAKWRSEVRPRTALERAAATCRLLGARARRGARGVRRLLFPAPHMTAGGSNALAGDDLAPTAAASREADLGCPCCEGDLVGDRELPRDHRQILVCASCGTGVSSPPPAREVEGDGIWTESYGGTRLSRRATWIAEAQRRVDWLELYASEGLLLEVGCGTGEFLKVATDAGFEAYGVEASHWAAEEARKLNQRVETGLVADWRLTYANFQVDVVALWHVLEHVPLARGLLLELLDVLKPGGLLVLEVPNFSSTEAQRLGVAWPMAQLSDHFVHFTPLGLGEMFSSSGYEVHDIIPMTRRVYSTQSSWLRERNEFIMNRRPWPPLDLVRVVARKGQLTHGFEDITTAG